MKIQLSLLVVSAQNDPSYDFLLRLAVALKNFLLVPGTFLIPIFHTFLLSQLEQHCFNISICKILFRKLIASAGFSDCSIICFKCS